MLAIEDRRFAERGINGDVTALAGFPGPRIDPGVLRQIERPVAASLFMNRRHQQIAAKQVLVFQRVGARVVLVVQEQRAHHR